MGCSRSSRSPKSGDDQAGLRAGAQAAREARARVADLRPDGDTVERVRFGLALMSGEVLYGNIGGGNRLDFTCIGPAVNLAARLEKSPARSAAPSSRRKALPASAGEGGAISASFPVAGFSKAARVYGLADETSAA